MGKTIRKNKFGGKYLDKDRKRQKASRSCLHSGGCPYCEGNRLHNFRVRKLYAEMEINAFSRELY